MCRGFFYVQWVEVTGCFVDIVGMVHHHCLHYSFEVITTSAVWADDE